MRRTGLSADVIRAWEKRYGVVTPARSVSGRRLYTDADVERLQLLTDATLTGRTIGQLAELSNDTLATLVRVPHAVGVRDPTSNGTDRTSPTGTHRTPAGSAEPSTPPPDDLGLCLQAVEALDAEQLDAVLRRAVLALDGESFLDGLVVPLWERVGERERARTLRPAHRHLTLAVLRRALARVSDAAAAPRTAPVLLVTMPPGFLHASQELGALLTTALAATEGWRVIAAGDGPSAEDVADLAVALGARVVAVSLGTAPSDRTVPRELRRLRAALGRDVVILLQGAAAAAHHALAREIGATLVHDLASLRARLRRPGPAIDSNARPTRRAGRAGPRA